MSVVLLEDGSSLLLESGSSLLLEALAAVIMVYLINAGRAV